MSTFIGVDVSQWQGDIDYDQLKDAVSFVIYRGTGADNGLYVDTEFLRNHTADDGVLGDVALANRYKALQMFMKQDMDGVQVYRVGSRPQIHAYALGRMMDGTLAGFKTVLTET